jgi:hypothetical protein
MGKGEKGLEIIEALGHKLLAISLSHDTGKIFF